jgi:DNA-binding NtrC family response regulator
VTDDRVLISTHDLPVAGQLREGFKASGYSTDLVTPDEDLSADDSAVLLVLTGGAEEGGGSLASQARTELHIPVFAIAAHSSLAPALRPGFDEVFPRGAPVDDIVLLGSRLVERGRLQRLIGILGETDAMMEVLERVVQIAPVAATVLVTGESGTGKELIARGLHALSPRRHKPFIAVNVAALSDTLLESELFGHEKGAFTGAIDARRGLFELSHGGTIFLDEIGEMPLATQTKLLRVLEEREFHRVGGEHTIKVDVRIVAATNQDLRQMVAIGEFRRDLYFRINVLSIALPALRERRDDIRLLVETFVQDASECHDRVFPGISAEAMELLIAYSWPGNVRELKNLVESMVVLAPRRAIRPEDLPEEVRSGAGLSLLPAPIRRVRGGEQGRTDFRPELEFVFRTLVELRVDMDELKREFDVYRHGGPVSLPGETLIGQVGSGSATASLGGGGIELGAYSPSSYSDGFEEVSSAEFRPEARVPDDSVVVFRAGMTMEDLERRAIAAALESVRGNRRKAAEQLGIGERTLYRKIAKYGLDD